MKKMRKQLALLALAAVLVCAVAVQPALAYFTTYAEAYGGYVVRLGSEVQETFDSWTKTIAIKADENAVPVYLRARAFVATGEYAHTLEYTGEGWVNGGDEWWYYGAKEYGTILYGGQTANALNVKIYCANLTPEQADSFSVVVVYETTPVVYDDSGNALPANWDNATRVEGATWSE